MPKFLFVARDREGRKIQDIQDAVGEDDLIRFLQSKGLLIISVREVKPEEIEVPLKPKKSRFSRRRIKSDDLVFFARQLSILLDAGVTLLRSIDIISQQIESRDFSFVIEKIRKDVEQGTTFRDSLAKHRRVFSELWVNLSEIGEASGNLAIVLDRLARFLETRAAFRREITSAMIYPMILFFVAIGAISFFVLRIIPTFMEVIKGFGVKLPLLTQMVISISSIAKRTFIPSILIFIVLFFLFRRFINTENGRRIFDNFKLRMPLFSKFFRNLTLERFSSEMSTLIESGVPLLYSLEITERAVGNKIVSEMIKKTKESVRDGKTLTRPLSDFEFFPPLLVQMVSVGEETGNLAAMFKKIASYYEEYTLTLIKRLTAMFEPLMIVFMGIIIGGLVISMFLPIFSIATMTGR